MHRTERYMRASEVLVIGAGPYGLSISTRLRGRGIDHVIVGRPMVPGLYFAGAPAAFGLSPSMRFIAGTHNLSGHLVRSVALRAKGSRGGRPPSHPGGASSAASGSTVWTELSRNG
jgi:hypothetical protein